MPSAEARIDTEHASRYLTQLCQHVTSIYTKGPALMRHRRRRHPPGGAPQPAEPPPRVEWTETHGAISFRGGTLTLRATPDSLIVRADAETEQDLQHAQDLVSGLLTRFGRRDHLTVSWHPLDPLASPSVDQQEKE
jgi:hypothetical protein